MKGIRKPKVAGMFYPAEPSKLKSEIELLLSLANPPENPEAVFGIVSPHAGYIYSGRTASFGYKLLTDKDIETVVIISPSHREYFPGVCVYEGEGYETPLGFIPLNNDKAGKIVEGSKSIYYGLDGHREEHAIEVQLPFLQAVLKNFTFVPLVMGDQSKIFIDELAAKLSQVADENTLIVASSDLSHYYTSDEANMLDSIVEQHVRDFDFKGLGKDLDERKCEACGGGTIVTLMKTASLLGYKHSLVLDRTDSSDTSGDHSQVVGYMSAVIYRN